MNYSAKNRGTKLLKTNCDGKIRANAMLTAANGANGG